jgi:prophage DNA circulation protein
MAELPSLILKGLGIFLILIGISGTIGGIYALKVVSGYGFGTLSEKEAGTMKTSISDLVSDLDEHKTKIENTIDNTAASLEEASEAIESSGEKISLTSKTMGSASKNLTNAAITLREASLSNKNAGGSLDSSANYLETWATNFRDANGDPMSLDQKTRFDEACAKMKEASNELKETGNRLDSTASNLEKTASNLQATSLHLQESAQELKAVGEKISESSKRHGLLKSAIGDLIVYISDPLKSSVRDVDTAIYTTAGVTLKMKTVLYGAIGYFILLHIIMIGAGISLLVIEVNLFYPISR